jgi:hypothetical protein
VGFPGAQTDSGRIEVIEAPAPPELFLIDPVAAFDLAVLLGTPRLDVPVPDPQGLHGQRECEGELLPVVALQLPDPEEKCPAELGQEGEARALVQSAIEAQDAKARAVIQRGVLEGPAPRDLHKLDVDLDGLAGLRLFKQLHLSRHPLLGPPDIPKDPVNRADGYPHVVNAPEPELSALCPILELAAGLPDKFDDPRRYPPATTPGVPRHESLKRILPPPSNRPHADAEAAPRHGRAMKSCEMQHHQPLPHPPPVLQAHLHIAQFDHVALPWGSSAAHQSRRVNLE